MVLLADCGNLRQRVDAAGVGCSGGGNDSKRFFAVGNVLLQCLFERIDVHTELGVGWNFADLVSVEADDMQPFGNRGMGLVGYIGNALRPFIFSQAVVAGSGQCGQVCHRAAGNKHSAATFRVACQ